MSGSVSNSGGEKDVEQQLQIFSTGQRVEVSSNEEGFKGAWFVGIVVESNRKSRTKLLVQYETLLAEDRKRPLKEYITIPFIRPEPPPVLPHNSSSSFQINDLVDAFHRDAWWAGVITRVLDDDQFVVSFQNPSEDITFSGSSLRFHLDWRDGKWTRPTQFQKMEEQNVGALDTEKVKQSRGKRGAKKSKVRKSAASATGGRKSNARRDGSEEIIDIVKDTRELQDENPSEVHPPHLQHLVDSEIQTGKENDGLSSVENNLKRKRGRPLLNKQTGQSIQKGEKIILLPMKSPSTVQSNVKRKRGRPALTSPSSAHSTEVRKRGRPPLKRPINSVGRTKASVKDSSDASTGEDFHSKANKVNVEMPSSDVFPGLPTLSAEEGISSQTIMHDLRVSPDLCTIINQHGPSADGQNGNEIGARRDDEEEEFVDHSWPFDKCSPLWKTIESMQVFKKAPQKPHFSSLSKCEEQFREGLAIGCMVTFASTVDRISKLQISDPTSVIDRYLETLVELEYHGFNVEPFRACLKELLAKKQRESQLQEESKQVVNEIAEHHLEKTRLENEINEIEAKIREHQQTHGATISMKDSMDQELARLQSVKDRIGGDITTVRLHFQNMVATPL